MKHCQLAKESGAEFPRGARPDRRTFSKNETFVANSRPATCSLEWMAMLSCTSPLASCRSLGESKSASNVGRVLESAEHLPGPLQSDRDIGVSA